MRVLSADTTANILTLLQYSVSQCQIAQRTGVSLGSVSNLCRKHLPELAKSIGGRPSLLSDHDIRHATRLITSGEADTAVQVTQKLQNIKNKSFSSQTMHRALKAHGLKAVVKKKKPLLSKKHRKDRLDWTIEHKD